MQHALVAWNCKSDVIEAIKFTKIDIALDMAGCFLPRDARHAFNAIKSRLQEVVSAIFDRADNNMISSSRLSGLEVRSGDNTIDSCFQYRVMDDDKSKLLVVKIYDKIMDLIGRDGIQQVGSKLYKILGCGRKLDVFQK